MCQRQRKEVPVSLAQGVSVLLARETSAFRECLVWTTDSPDAEDVRLAVDQSDG